MNKYKRKLIILADALEINRIEEFVESDNQVIEGVGRTISNQFKNPMQDTNTSIQDAINEMTQVIDDK